LEKIVKIGNRPCITKADVKAAEKDEIPNGSAIIFATGWGQHWDKPDFLTNSWFFKKDAVEYLVSKTPFIFAADTPSFDNVEGKQGIWDLIFNNNILIVAPLINIEQITKYKVKLYVCPLKILNTTGLPCRVIIVE
jgi:kynurenine formamidase